MDASSICVFAIQGAAAPAGRSSLAGRAIIVACLLLGVAFALRSAAKSLGCGRCRGSGATGPKPESKAIGAVVATRTLRIDGMHCENCVSRVRKALDAIDGVSSEVSLESGGACVRMDRAVPDETLRKAVEDQGFSVTAVS